MTGDLLIDLQDITEVADCLAENVAALMTAYRDWRESPPSSEASFEAYGAIEDALTGCRAALDAYYEAKGGDDGDLS